MSKKKPNNTPPTPTTPSTPPTKTPLPQTGTPRESPVSEPEPEAKSETPFKRIPPRSSPPKNLTHTETTVNPPNSDGGLSDDK